MYFKIHSINLDFLFVFFPFESCEQSCGTVIQKTIPMVIPRQSSFLPVCPYLILFYVVYTGCVLTKPSFI